MQLFLCWLWSPTAVFCCWMHHPQMKLTIIHVLCHWYKLHWALLVSILFIRLRKYSHKFRAKYNQIGFSIFTWNYVPIWSTYHINISVTMCLHLSGITLVSKSWALPPYIYANCQFLCINDICFFQSHLLMYVWVEEIYSTA